MVSIQGGIQIIFFVLLTVVLLSEMCYNSFRIGIPKVRRPRPTRIDLSFLRKVEIRF